MSLGYTQLKGVLKYFFISNADNDSKNNIIIMEWSV